MHILEYENYIVTPSQEAFLIKPIRDLYNADKSDTKESFMQQMSILYFMSDPRSSYTYILDSKIRLQEILRQEGLPSDYKISKDLQKAIDEYKNHVTTPTSELVQATRTAISKLSNYLADIDLHEEDDKGKPKYTISNITTALKQIPDLLKQLNEVEKKLLEDLEDNEARGSQQKSIMEDGLFRIK